MDTKLILIAFITIIISATKIILLPLSMASFGGNTGIYFVIWINSLLFNFYFSPMTYLDYKNKTLTKEMIKFIKDNILSLVIIGFCNTLNGIFMCYSISLSRTSGVLPS